jgi:hypothetical protein
MSHENSFVVQPRFLRVRRWQTHRIGVDVDVARKWFSSTATVSPRELTGQRACLSAYLAYVQTTGSNHKKRQAIAEPEESGETREPTAMPLEWHA